MSPYQKAIFHNYGTILEISDCVSWFVLFLMCLSNSITEMLTICYYHSQAVRP